jgi:hypothetical protein
MILCGYVSIVSFLYILISKNIENGTKFQYGAIAGIFGLVSILLVLKFGNFSSTPGNNNITRAELNRKLNTVKRMRIYYIVVSILFAGGLIVGGIFMWKYINNYKTEYTEYNYAAILVSFLLPFCVALPLYIFLIVNKQIKDLQTRINTNNKTTTTTTTNANSTATIYIKK